MTRHRGYPWPRGGRRYSSHVARCIRHILPARPQFTDPRLQQISDAILEFAESFGVRLTPPPA